MDNSTLSRAADEHQESVTLPFADCGCGGYCAQCAPTNVDLARCRIPPSEYEAAIRVLRLAGERLAGRPLRHDRLRNHECPACSLPSSLDAVLATPRAQEV